MTHTTIGTFSEDFLRNRTLDSKFNRILYLSCSQSKNRGEKTLEHLVVANESNWDRNSVPVTHGPFSNLWHPCLLQVFLQQIYF